MSLSTGDDQQQAEPVAPDLTDGIEPVSDVHAGELPIPAAAVGSLQEFVRSWIRQVRGGSSGALPVVLALVLIVIFFEAEQSKYLSAGNIENLLAYASIFVMFGMAETFALLLSEIDLSIAYVGFTGAMVTVEFINNPFNWPWWAATLVGLASCAFIGFLQGVIVARVRIPSFVVTLAGLLFFEGFLIYITSLDKSAVGGTLRIPSTNVLWGIINRSMSPTASWIVLVAGLVVFAGYLWGRDARRRSSGLSAPPRSVTALVILAVAVIGVALVWVLNVNRGSAFVVLEGVPYFVLVVVGVLILWTVLTGRTRFGRYLYAIGANPEAARRAGIQVAVIRTGAFMLCSLTAGIAGILYASNLGSMGINVTGGSITLLGVAAAVIGGSSLFGGRGKPAYAVLGGIIIGAIYNGLGLLGVSAEGTDMTIAVVLLASATVDTFVRRRSLTA